MVVKGVLGHVESKSDLSLGYFRRFWRYKLTIFAGLNEKFLVFG